MTSPAGAAVAHMEAVGHPAAASTAAFYGLPNPIRPITTTVDAVATLATDVVRVEAWITDQHNWLRIGYVILGAIMVIVGISMTMSRQTTTLALDIARRVV